MPRFQYKAYTTDGAVRHGEIEASNAESAKGLIYDQGLLPVDATPASNAPGTLWWQRDLFAGNQLPMEEIVRFTRELATLLGADLTIDDALRLAAVRSRNSAAAGFSERLLDRVLAGQSLSDAIEDDALNLPSSYAPMVRAGEASGALVSVVDELATLLERGSEVQGKIRSALVYPTILFVVAMIAVAMIMIVLLPNLIPVFENAAAPLPATLTVLLSIKAFIADYLAVCLAGLATVLTGLVLAFKSERGRDARDRTSIRLPVVGRFIRDLETARFARVLGTLMKNGVPLVTGMEITANVARNGVFRKGLTNAIELIREGAPLRDAIAAQGLISPVGQRLIAVGEQSGRLDAMLLHLAVVLEKDLKTNSDRLLALLTPALTLLIGLGVGALILSVMAAILSVNDVVFQ